MSATDLSVGQVAVLAADARKGHIRVTAAQGLVVAARVRCSVITAALALLVT
ncbi:hypothetical protein QZH47_29890 [Pseudomonas corrugata]